MNLHKSKFPTKNKHLIVCCTRKYKPMMKMHTRCELWSCWNYFFFCILVCYTFYRFDFWWYLFFFVYTGYFSIFMIIKPTTHIQKFVNLWESCIGFCAHKQTLSFRKHKTYMYLIEKKKAQTHSQRHIERVREWMAKQKGKYEKKNNDKKQLQQKISTKWIKWGAIQLVNIIRKGYKI